MINLKRLLQKWIFKLVICTPCPLYGVQITGGVCLKISERNWLGSAGGIPPHTQYERNLPSARLALPARPKFLSEGGNRSGKNDFKFFFGGKFLYLSFREERGGLFSYILINASTDVFATALPITSSGRSLSFLNLMQDLPMSIFLPLAS